MYFNANSQSPPIDLASLQYSIYDSSPGVPMTSQTDSEGRSAQRARGFSEFYFKPTKIRSTASYTNKIRLCSVFQKQDLQEDMVKQVGADALRSIHEFRLKQCHSDKIFGSCWLRSRNHICTVGKDNRLFLYDIESNTFKKISLPFEDMTYSFTNQNGMHAIATSPEDNYIITGAMNPNDCVVFELPTFVPVCICKNHKSWVFGISPISETEFLSCGRDHTINMWSYANHVEMKQSTYDPYLYSQEFCPKQFSNRTPTLKPVASLSNLGIKLRDITVDRFEKKFATTSTNGIVSYWDLTRFEAIDSIYTKKSETVVIRRHEETGLYAVGTKEDVTFVDTRASRPVSYAKSQDQGWGVRSLAFNRDILAIGGGAGRVSFYDMRAGAYSPIGHGASTALYISEKDFEPLSHNIQTFALSRLNAVYTLAWSRDGSSLYCGGGPLQCGLSGSWGKILF